MSWPSTDFECEIQSELDELHAFKSQFKAWLERPAESKETVLKDLKGIQHNWSNAARDDQEAQDDAQTLKVIIDLLERCE